MTNHFRVAGIALVVCLALIACTSCSRAPSFDILGSFFPAWLICFASGIALTIAFRWILLVLRIPLALPVLAYPSLSVLFTFALWLIYFR